MIIGQKEFDVWNRTYVMGILNTTPDQKDSATSSIAFIRLVSFTLQRKN